MSDNTGPVKGEPRTKNVKELIEVLSTKPETPMLDQESPKNDFFILQDSWPVFKVFQFFGLFPCKKETNEKGAIQLKPIKWWIPVTILSILLILLIGTLLGYLISSSKEVADYLIAFFRCGLSENAARYYVSRIYVPVWFIFQSGLLWSLMKKRKELCALQEIFSTTPLNYAAKKGANTLRKTRVYFVLIIALSLFGFVFNTIDSFLPLHELLTTNASIVLNIIIAFLFCMLQLFIHLPMINIVILYLQLTCNIMNSIEEIDLNSLKFGTILENTAHLMKRVNMTSSFLSPQCFFGILVQTLALIVEFFVLIDYSTGSSHFFYPSFVSKIFLSMSIFCILNWQSYDVKQRLSEIRLYIFNFAITENNFVVIDTQKHPEEYARKIVMSMLEEFRGFDANGYFTLGKDLLGYIIMLCITYVIVLIEFRIPLLTKTE